MWREHGLTTHRVFLETEAEPKLTWLYSLPVEDAQRPTAGLDAVVQDPAYGRIVDDLGPHVFKNTLVRPVEVAYLTHAEPAELADWGEEPGTPVGMPGPRIAIMRRYSIVGGWETFLDLWRRIVPLRARHGFSCLFATIDREKDMFTWAFDFDGLWEEFPQAQREYYRDPERIGLRNVFDHMADYSIHPARMLV